MVKTINPYTNKVISEINEHSVSEVNLIVCDSNKAFLKWREFPISLRAESMKSLANVLKEKKEELAQLITAEMGKLIGESLGEIDKCVWLCEYYAEHTEDFLEAEGAPSDGTVSYIRYDPLGVIYCIMPWNFPFWQVLRFAVPTLMGGNTVILKHAPNVFGCAKALEQLFSKSGFPENVFRNIFIPIELSEGVIANELVQGVTLTGSQDAGKIVASQAGKYLKKSVLELGGSDPYIVLSDADLKTACSIGTQSRMMNSGQVCISAKRFIVQREVFDTFVSNQKKLLEKLTPGDPLDPLTNFAPLARKDLLEALDQQVQQSVKMGAKLIMGGYRIAETNFYAPTLLINVKKGMPVFDEETFGPVSVVVSAENAEDAIRIANDTPFGLAASVWTADLELADEMASKIDAGAVFINGMTKSDPRLPFGGTKRSGYGRELSRYGIMEFLNLKTVWIK